MKTCPILAVCSGKGGVGKSTVAFSLAKSLTQAGYAIGLIDADIYGPSLHLLFKEMGQLKPENKGSEMVPPCIESIYFMSAAFFAPGGAFIRAPKALGLAKSFFHQTLWPTLDLIIVDFPPGTGDLPLTLFQEITFEGAVLVTTPHTLSVEDSAKSGVQILQSGIPIMGIVETMSYLSTSDGLSYPMGQGGGRELEEMFKCPLLVQLPLYDQSKECVVTRVAQSLILDPFKQIIDKSRVCSK